jgi:hypothetical protein
MLVSLGVKLTAQHSLPSSECGEWSFNQDVRLLASMQKIHETSGSPKAFACLITPIMFRRGYLVFRYLWRVEWAYWCVEMKRKESRVLAIEYYTAKQKSSMHQSVISGCFAFNVRSSITGIQKKIARQRVFEGLELFLKFCPCSFILPGGFVYLFSSRRSVTNRKTAHVVGITDRRRLPPVQEYRMTCPYRCMALMKRLRIHSVSPISCFGSLAKPPKS